MSTRLMGATRLRQKVAGSDPRRWMLNREFWRGHRLLVIAALAGFVVFVVLAPFTYRGLAAVLSLLVQSLAAWGLAIAVRALASLDVDLALMGEIDDGGTGYLSDLAAGRRQRVVLDQIERTLVPNNLSLPQPGPIRLVQQICKEARDRRFESAATLVQPYRDEATEDVFRLQNLQKIALWLGILGTFLGLLVALHQSGVTASDDDSALNGLVQQMYGGLYVSFTASVAGLEVAIFLGFVLLILRRRQELYFARLESGAVTMLSVARHSVIQDDLLAEFTQVTAAVRDLAAQVRAQTREHADDLGRVEGRLSEQNERIDAGLDRLAGARAEFERFLSAVGRAEHEFLTDLAELFAAASFKDLALAIRTGAHEAGEQLSCRLDDVATRSAAQIGGFDRSVQALTTSVQRQSVAFDAGMDALANELVAASNANAEAVCGACERLAAAVMIRVNDLRPADPGYQLLAERIAELNRSLGRLTIAPQRRRLNEWLSFLIPGGWRNGSRNHV